MTDKPVTELTDDEVRAEYRYVDFALNELWPVWIRDERRQVAAIHNDRRHALGIEMIRRGISP